MCLDRTMQPDRVLTKPFVLTMLAEFALCMSIGMLLAVVPVYADRRPRRRELRRRPRGRGRQPDGARLPAARRAICGPEGPADPRHRRRHARSDRGCWRTSSPTHSRSSSSCGCSPGAGEAMALVGAATIVTDLAPEHRRGEALSVFSLGLWGGLALGPLARRARARRHALRRRVAARGGVLPRRGADRPRAPGDGAVAGLPAGLRAARSSIPRPIGPGLVLVVHRPRLRGSRDVRRAVRARPRPRRRGVRLPRVLGRRRRDARPRAAGARPARAKTHVPTSRSGSSRRGSSRSGSGTSPPGCTPGPSSSPSATRSRSRR